MRHSLKFIILYLSPYRKLIIEFNGDGGGGSSKEKRRRTLVEHKGCSTRAFGGLTFELSS